MIKEAYNFKRKWTGEAHWEVSFSIRTQSLTLKMTGFTYSATLKHTKTIYSLKLSSATFQAL